NLTGKVSATEEGQARIEAILGAARDEVRTMLGEHRHVIERLRDALLERDELIGDEILDEIRSVAPESRGPRRIVHVDGERLPAAVLGLTTIVATWQPMSVVFVAQSVAVPPSPSSQVRRSTT